MVVCWNWWTSSPTSEAASYQLKRTLTPGWWIHEQLSISYRSYGSQTCPIKNTQIFPCTTWTLAKCIEKKLDTRMLRAVLNIPWRKHLTKQQLYGYLLPIRKIIKIRRSRYGGHCYRSKDQLISDVLLWTPLQGRARVVQPARTYIQKLSTDTGCNQEELPGVMLAARYDDYDGHIYSYSCQVLKSAISTPHEIGYCH